MWKKICESEEVSDEDRVLSALETAYKDMSIARSILEQSADIELRKKYLRTIADIMNMLDYEI